MNLIKKQTGHWEPIHLFHELQDEMNQLFRHSVLKRKDWAKGFAPDLEVKEESDRLVVRAEIPGVKKEDLDIKVEGKTLILKGEKKEEREGKEKDCFFSERSYGAFLRSLQLPCEIKAEEVKASSKDGVLEIVLPKAESAKTKQVKVEVK